jgi:hypothetical protein
MKGAYFTRHFASSAFLQAETMQDGKTIRLVASAVHLSLEGSGFFQEGIQLARDDLVWSPRD